MKTQRLHVAAALTLGVGLLVLVVGALSIVSAPFISHASPLNQVGNPCGNGFQINVIPPLPTQNDTVSVTYSAEWSYIPTPEHQSHQVMGSVIRLDAVYHVPEVGLPVIAGWGGEAGVGNLTSGTYTVQVYLTTVTSPTVFPPELCGTQSFTVYEEPQQAPEDLYVARTGVDSGDCTNSDFPCRTVQYAVDQAGEGNTIKVASGIYTGVQGRLASPGYGGPSVITQVVYLSKTVTIQGGYTATNWTTPDPEAHPTTLDAQGNGRVLFVTGNITPTIAGLHITGGNAAMLGGGGPSRGDDAGDGVYVITATVSLNNNWVFDNTATPSLCAYGGGLYFQSSSATLSGNKVFSNTGCVGGGVLVYDSTAVLDANTVFSNTGFQTGGGLSLANSVVTLTGNIVSSNTGYYGGGGVLVYESNATLNGNTITSNIITGDNSGGVALVRSNSTLNGNTIACNTSSGTGGGVGFFEGTATLINNVIADNRTNWAGGGIYVSDASADLLHNTIVRNVGGDGAGIYVTNNSTVAMTNTILVSHTVGITVAAGSTVALEGTLWGSGAWANTTDWGGPGTIITGTSAYNYWSDPAFVNPNAGDYHIRYVSAALNAGIDAGVTEDIDGDPRSDGYPDIGADELGVGLSVTKRAYPRAVEAGARLTYTIRVTNTGSADLHAVITDTLPLSVTLGGMLSGTVLLPGRTVVLPDGMVGITWTASITAPGSVWMETVVVTVEMGYSGLLTNVVEVTTEESATGIYTETVVARQRSIYLPLFLRNR